MCTECAQSLSAFITTHASALTLTDSSPSLPLFLRSYTTDFDEMEELFSLEKNPNLKMDELEAMLAEFRQDYNQKHFVRNESFKKAADNVQGESVCGDMVLAVCACARARMCVLRHEQEMCTRSPSCFCTHRNPAH